MTTEPPRAVAGADTREMTLTGSVTPAPDDARQLEAEIERTREQLGRTVQELAARADVKSRARAKATEVTDRLKGTAAQVRGNASARAKSVRDQVAGTTGAARRQAASAGASVTKGARDYWMPAVIGAGVIALDYVAVRQWRSGR